MAKLTKAQREKLSEISALPRGIWQGDLVGRERAIVQRLDDKGMVAFDDPRPGFYSSTPAGRAVLADVSGDRADG